MSTMTSRAPAWTWTPLSAEAEAALQGAMAAVSIRDSGVIWRLVEGDSNERGGNGGPEHSASESDWRLVQLLIEGGCRDAEIIAEIVQHSGCLVPDREGKLLRRRDYVSRLIAKALKSAKPEKGERPDATTGPIPTRSLGELRANPDLLRVPDPLSAWLVWRGELTLLVGREKLAGKSTLAAADALRAMRGGHDVLWLTAEESLNRVVTRFADLRAPDDDVLVPERWPKSWEEVEALIAARRPGAVYVDSLASFLMAVDGAVPQTSEGEAWQAKVLRFKSWTTIGAGGVCVLLHATKESGSYRGSTGIGAAPDTIVTMRDVPEGGPTYRRLETIGRWGFPSKVVRFVDAARGYEEVNDLDVKPASIGPRITVERQRVLTSLPGAAVAPTGSTWGEWLAAYATARKAKEITGGLRSTFNGAIAWLRAEGLVTLNDETGRYVRDEIAVNETVPDGK